MTGSRLPEYTVKAVGDRARGYCERCGVSLVGPFGYSHHHRIPRGMGGTRDALLSHPSNIVLVCGSGTTGCHGSIEIARTASYFTGWLLKRTTSGVHTDPREHPIWLTRLDSWMIPGPGRWFALPERIEGS